MPGTVIPADEVDRHKGLSGVNTFTPWRRTTRHSYSFLPPPRTVGLREKRVFLANREARAVQLDVQGKSVSGELFLGQGALGLEVVAFTAAHRPSFSSLRSAFEARAGRRAAPVLIAVLWGDDRAALFGPTSQNPMGVLEIPRTQASRICDVSLEAPDRHSAIRFLNRAIPQLEAPIPGLRNSGLFALQELRAGVPLREDWDEARRRSINVYSLRGRDLIHGLGFQTEHLPGPATILLAKGAKTAIAVFLERPEEIDTANQAFDGVSPVSFALARADRERLDYVVVSAGSTLRVYPAKPGVGTGRRGRTETYVEVNHDLLGEDHSGYLWLLFGADALSDGGTFQEILNRSEEFAVDLGARLRDRVYVEVVPQLAQAVSEARELKAPSQQELKSTYQAALEVLFRLLFVAYAEDKELLPLHQSAAYRDHSLKRIAQRLVEAKRAEKAFGSEGFYWREISLIWTAVDKGNPEWGVPAYNGGLFSSDPDTSATGALLADLSLPDSAFVPALTALLVDRSEEGVEGPVDFRSLSVREFGTIYEGLLESELSVAEQDLSVDPESGAYFPADLGTEVAVPAGEVYLHNAAGARKATGSYFTKAFAVDHLLDRALEPALDDHLGQLDELDTREAGKRFFEFRVADIAMGSGHFLVAAVDRIERRLSNYLASRNLPDVHDELFRLRQVAVEALGDEWAGDPIEDSQLLRRQIARRCIFGVDLNETAVELARLSIWIHTFVPGLPLSLLDYSLVRGNSLVGVATFDEAADLIVSDEADLFAFSATERLSSLQEPLNRLAGLTDANDAEIREAREIYEQTREAIRAENDFLTVLTASRIDSEIQAAVDQGQIATRLRQQGDVFSDRLIRRANDLLEGTNVLHFPVAFPHVFLGKRGGFDVILGNPPWEKAHVEEHEYWCRHVPGFRGLTQRERAARYPMLREERPDLARQFEAERRATDTVRALLLAGRYPGMGSGHPDLYKAFTWRFWDLVTPDGGRIGVVLPRSAMAAKGSTEFRRLVFERAETVDVTTLLNSGRWVFDMEPRYTVGLIALKKTAISGDAIVSLSGPFSNLSQYRAGLVREPPRFYGSEVRQWSDSVTLPLLPGKESVDVLSQLGKAPRLDMDEKSSWRVRPIQGDLNATTGAPLLDFESGDCPPGYWPVFKGESFDLWNPDTGSYYAWADPEVVLPELQNRREQASSRSAFSEFSDEWRSDPGTLPCLKPRIAFRDISRATDTRTVRAALVPGEVIITHQAPFFVWPRGTAKEEAFLLGVLSSIPLDWFARRFVETHLTFFVINPFPIPRPVAGDPLREKVVQLAGRLAASDERFSGWADLVEVGWGPLQPDEKEYMINELDAAVAHLFGLSEVQLTHIFETFHEGWDYEERLTATLEHFHSLRRLR